MDTLDRSQVDVSHFTFRVTWSAEDGEFVATCLEFPSMSWLAPARNEAIDGLERLVVAVVDDMRANHERVPEHRARPRPLRSITLLCCLSAETGKVYINSVHASQTLTPERQVTRSSWMRFRCRRTRSQAHLAAPGPTPPGVLPVTHGQDRGTRRPGQAPGGTGKAPALDAGPARNDIGRTSVSSGVLIILRRGRRGATPPPGVAPRRRPHPSGSGALGRKPWSIPQLTACGRRVIPILR